MASHMGENGPPAPRDAYGRPVAGNEDFDVYRIMDGHAPPNDNDTRLRTGEELANPLRHNGD